MLRRTCHILVAVAALVAAKTGFAIDKPLDAISDEASLVIRLKSPETTIGKIAKLANQVQPGTGAMLQVQAQGLGILISNPTMAGVDQKQDWLVAAFASAEGEPGVLFAIPATDPKAVESALGAGFKTTIDGNWVFYSDDEDTVKKAEARIAGKGQSIADQIDDQSQSIFDGGDLSVYINVHQLRKVYKSQLDKADKSIDDALKKFSNLPIQAPGMNLDAVWDMYGAIARGFLQGVRDSESCTVAVAVNRSGLAIEEYLRVGADSATDKFLASNETSDLKLLDRLPSGKLAYFGAHGNSTALVQWAMGLSSTMYEGNEGLKKAFEKTHKALDGVKFGGMVGAFALGSLADGALQGISVVEVTPVEKIRDLSREFIRSFDKLEIAGMTQEYQLKEDAEEFGKHSADVVTVKTEMDEKMDPMGIQKKLMAALYGPDGMTTRNVYLKDKMVQALGSAKTMLSDVLESLESQASDSESAHAVTRQQLLPKANLLVLFDLPSFVLEAAKRVAESGQVPVPITPDMLSGMNVTPSYIGFSMATVPQGLRTKTVVPVEQFQGIMQLVTFGQQLWMQQQLKQQH